MEVQLEIPGPTTLSGGHLPWTVSHQSAWVSGFEGNPRGGGIRYAGFQINPAAAMALVRAGQISKEEYLDWSLPTFAAYDRARIDEAEQRLGPVRAWKLAGIHANVFPNFALLWQAGRCAYGTRRAGPYGMWGWCVVDKAAPQDVRDITRRHVTQRHSASGTWEADDATIGSTARWRVAVASRSATRRTSRWVSARDYASGIAGPGRIVSVRDQSAGFYQRWAELMEAA
jgi:3-phenylpropionate/trans-cinnamate dioxygenase alpha subunit